MLRLFFRAICLGTVTDAEIDWPWTRGAFAPNKAAARFADLLAWHADETRAAEETPPFDRDLLDEANWTVMDDDGRSLGITVPGVRPDGTIAWRWR